MTIQINLQLDILMSVTCCTLKHVLPFTTCIAKTVLQCKLLLFVIITKCIIVKPTFQSLKNV